MTDTASTRTTFLLHGGKMSRSSSANDAYIQEVLSYVPEGGTLVVSLHARPQMEWEDKFHAVLSSFSQFSDSSISILLADADISMFVQQILQADALYFVGGSTPVLVSFLSLVPDIRSLLSGKCVAGSSAGAMAFAEQYYSNDDSAIHDGLRILPLSIVCHMRPDLESILHQLSSRSPHTKLLTLREEEYVKYFL